MNLLFNMYIEWNQDKPKEVLQDLVAFGIEPSKAMIIGKGEAKFHLYTNNLKRNMKTDQLIRLREEIQRDMSSLENTKQATEDLRMFFVRRVGDIERAIRRSVHLYEKTKMDKKEDKKKKKFIDNELEKHLRKKGY